ncbi:alpha-ketoglutarate-dependent dioxygenase AlkB [Cellulophaga baltica]|uniref:alpha-ketoglutarate-dependent dioxygenase AlkB family protein n=1 Tax=Cellulophaga TaxID=104264 RepID=UPI001C074471|nr:MULTISPECIES: alpha-ketoglutarate-dependent dioxygenase AlkB [Cellulophaga]MBU2998067.1 alpha-ketoglutarate-dependent dioxygenase AlkB [Cellulophaga baltica]MDO6769469.1 alpha-ketoglutarate-dependent dioxygenase AlkB [Cellulophaga sp. 1_MG-2023]
MNSLFSEPVHLNLPDSDISYYPNFLASDFALEYFEVFRKTISWQQDDIKVFGKVYAQPRLTALYADNDKPYSYSGITMQPHLFTKELLELKKLVEEKSNTSYTTCLLNLYRNGKDSNGWHSDNEKELGENPSIASISLGQKRVFHLKHRTDKRLKHKMELESGSLLIMSGETQTHWLHQIPKTAKPINERINLTFRTII